MTEYFRTKTHQFCDVNLCMIIDTITGEPQKFGGRNIVGTLEEAIKLLKEHDEKVPWNCIDRLIIVKVDCIKGFKL